MPYSQSFLLLILLLVPILCLGDISEDFDGWTDDPDYNPPGYYDHPGVGIWTNRNALIRPDNARSGLAHRFDRDAPTPYLEFQGLDGNGIDGGVGSVSFYYRHWDGDGNTITFSLQYSIDGAGWIDAGASATVTTDATYQLFSRNLSLSADNVKLRVITSVNQERLLIDDFLITTAAASPELQFNPVADTVNEGDGVFLLPVELIPPGPATVNVERVSGTALEGVHYTLGGTTLVFTATSGVQNVQVNLLDDGTPEADTSLVLGLANPQGATLASGGEQHTLTIQDDDQPVTVEFAGDGITLSEAAGTLQVPVILSQAADATVTLARSGSAVSPSDYSLSPTTLVFTAAGATTQVATVTLVDDPDPEADESLGLTLSTPVGASLGARSSVTYVITDNDSVSTFTILSANTTSGNFQEYEGPGIRIFQALQPDIVGIQEFNVSSANSTSDYRDFVDSTFGTNYHYFVEAGNEAIPNGIISRYPITATGEWQDPQLSNRDFAWATIDIPGDTDLHVVSVHLHSSGGSSSRNAEAQVIVSQINSTFPASDYIAITGDFNVNSRTEAAVQTLKSIFSDAHVPVDQNGDDDTNANRNNPYDWVMANSALELRHASLTVGGIAFPNGIVFDTRVWGGSPPAPALANDSGASMMQHMAVMKAYSIPSGGVSTSYTLTVSTPYGTAVPTAGASSHAPGAVLAPHITLPTITAGTTQFVVSGWTGTGDVPTSGSGSSIPAFSVTTNSTLAWAWSTNYWLDVTALQGGSVLPTSNWFAASSTVQLTPQPPPYYSFDAWSGDVPGGEETDNPLSLLLNLPRVVTAGFLPDLAALGTPHFWLAGFGWTNNFDLAELDDTDLDGMDAWEEYVAGTNPTLQSSAFVITVATNGPTTLQIPTETGRTYTIEFTDQLAMEWQPFLNPAFGEYQESGPPGLHDFVDDYGPNTTGALPVGGLRTYRVRVRL